MKEIDDSELQKALYFSFVIDIPIMQAQHCQISHFHHHIIKVFVLYVWEAV